MAKQIRAGSQVVHHTSVKLCPKYRYCSKLRVATNEGYCSTFDPLYLSISTISAASSQACSVAGSLGGALDAQA